MDKKKLELILTLFLQGRTRKEIIVGANISCNELDSAMKEGLRLYAAQLEADEPEFNQETHIFSKKGFANNVDLLCARIENDPDFSTEEVLNLAKQRIETNYGLIIANHPLQERLAKYFTVPVKFPIIILSDQTLAIHEKLKKN